MIEDAIEQLKSNIKGIEDLRVQEKRKSARAKAKILRERLVRGRFDLGLLCDLLDELADGVTL